MFVYTDGRACQNVSLSLILCIIVIAKLNFDPQIKFMVLMLSFHIEVHYTMEECIIRRSRVPYYAHLE